MMDTLTVKDKDLRVLFFWRLPGTGVRCRSRNLIYKNRKVASSQARAIYKKASRSQARKLALYIKAGRKLASEHL
jgi:hypothetical protein